MPGISVVLISEENSSNNILMTEFKESPLVDKIFQITPRAGLQSSTEKIEFITSEYPLSSKVMGIIQEKVQSKFILLILQNGYEPGQFALERYLRTAEETDAGLVYSDYYLFKDWVYHANPLIDYQEGSIRDDFNFGKALFFSTNAFTNAYQSISSSEYKHAGLYNIRLNLSIQNRILRIPEFLYSINETDTRKSGEKQFDYVDPRNREVQIEMEKAVTEYLKKIGAYLEPTFKNIDLSEGEFANEVSVIIPVKNRLKTMADAINSVLLQKTDFPFNVIVADNHSNDGTTEYLKSVSRNDNRIIHIIPERTDLGIGGCWNEAVHHSGCGRFAVQLDSDDVYKDESTLQKIVNVFRKTNCAMVIGSYQITDFNLKEIPPGLIDHKEWTWHNGRNNALRINGLGAPRAFFTPLLRKIKVPNVSYGEDYALGLAISREYQIGRIYDSIYLCRRWEDNTDASLNVEKQNIHNLYKDRLRTIEITARKKLNGRS